MKRKLISVILIIALLQYFAGFVFAQNTADNKNEQAEKTLSEQQEENNEKIEETNTKLEYVQNELSSTMLKVQELEDKVLGYQSEMDTLSDQLNTLETSITDATQKLATVETEYETKRQLLADRLVALYEAGETSYLDVLVSSRSLTEFISGYYLISELADYDNNLIEKVEQQKTDIETTRAKLEREQTQLKVVKAKKEQTALVLKNTQTLQQSYIKRLNKEEKNLQQEITKYKLEQARIEALIRASANSTQDMNIQYTGGTMMWPVAVSGTYITSGYGIREHPIQGVIKQHTGIDISGGGVTYGSPAVAAADGVVSYAGWLGGYGNCVMINHGDGITTLYGHGQKVLVSLHQQVKQGDLIMEIGSTGNSTGPHLHFEVRVNGNYTNPLNYVKTP